MIYAMQRGVLESEDGDRLGGPPSLAEDKSMAHVRDTGERRRVRSLFVSDVHLGSRFAQAEAFLTFLEAYQPDYLYLVGDFVDGWSLQRSWRWRPVNTRILQHLLAWAWAGVTIRYASGNHDGFLRSFLKDFIWFEIADEFLHELADGRRFVVLHGDQFDGVESQASWLSKVGSLGYDLLLAVDHSLNFVRRWLRRKPWRLSAGVKTRIKRVVAFLSDFEQQLTEHARSKHCQGIICGHLHTPLITRRDDIVYCNTGDWVENCTALLEFDDGELRLVRFCPETGTITRQDSNSARLPTTSAAPAADAASSEKPPLETHA
jgi:UDP-2,3-diacylglucosamine pyrophosphatase LpxH